MGDGRIMNDRLLQLYETTFAWRACYGRSPTLAELARACGLKEWQCYAALVGLRRRVGRAAVRVTG